MSDLHTGASASQSEAPQRGSQNPYEAPAQQTHSPPGNVPTGLITLIGLVFGCLVGGLGGWAWWSLSPGLFMQILGTVGTGQLAAVVSGAFSGSLAGLLIGRSLARFCFASRAFTMVAYRRRQLWEELESRRQQLTREKTRRQPPPT